MKILTVIIPAYNVGEYLAQTLDSLVIPSINDKLEILIVDDGSVDDTRTIACKYCQKYPESMVYIYKQNGGHGSTINTGVKRATGKYLKILDGDDWVHKSALEALVHFLEDCSTDVVLTGYETWNMETGKTCLYTHSDVLFEKVYSVEKQPIMNGHFALTTVCYNTSFIKNLHFNLQEHTFYVDEEFIGIPLLYIKTWVYLDTHLYVYRIGNINQSINIQNKLKRIDHMSRVILRLLPYIYKAPDPIHQLPLLDRLYRLVTGYYLLTLVYYSHRNDGYRLFRKMQQQVAQYPELYKKCARKATIFRLAHFMHINGKTYDVIKSLPILKKFHQSPI